MHICILSAFVAGGVSARKWVVGVGASSDGQRHSFNISVGPGISFMTKTGVSGTIGVEK